MEDKTYLCIDLKTFYASVECVERGLDPFTTKLVVADPDRESTTICLAISPRMKELGVHNRCRLFEIPKDISYIVAKPRMKKYIEYSANIYAIYLKYISNSLNYYGPLSLVALLCLVCYYSSYILFLGVEINLLIKKNLLYHKDKED